MLDKVYPLTMQKYLEWKYVQTSNMKTVSQALPTSEVSAFKKQAYDSNW